MTGRKKIGGTERVGKYLLEDGRIIYRIDSDWYQGRDFCMASAAIGIALFWATIVTVVCALLAGRFNIHLPTWSWILTIVILWVVSFWNYQHHAAKHFDMLIKEQRALEAEREES